MRSDEFTDYRCNNGHIFAVPWGDEAPRSTVVCPKCQATAFIHFDAAWKAYWATLDERGAEPTPRAAMRAALEAVEGDIIEAFGASGADTKAKETDA